MNITKKRLLIYLGLSFGMAWLIFFIFIFTGHTWTGSSPEMLSLVSLGMLAPAIAHVITRKITNEGFRLIGEKSMMLGIDLKGKKWIFFLLAMFLPVVYSTLGDGILWLVFPEAFGETEYSLFVVIIYPLIAVVQGVVLSFAAFGEEFGWRAYMMPKLKALMGRYPALIVGGVIWGLWHAPLTCIGHNFGTDYPGFPYVGIIIMCLYCILLGGILTYVTEKTGSVWPAAFLHGVNNASPSILAAFMNAEKLSQVSLFKQIVCMVIPFVLICLILELRGRKKLM